MKFLNLGCGNSFHKDWINIDFSSSSEYVIEHNLLKGIPLEKDSIDVLYHSHVLEHFTKEDGEALMRECNRVLKKNGIIRIAVPDLETIVIEYLRNLKRAIEGDKEAEHNYEWIKLELLDQMIRNKSGGGMAEYLQRPEIPNENYVISRIGLEGENIRKNYLQQQISKNLSVSKIKYKSSRKKLIKESLCKLLKKIKIQQRLADNEVLSIGNFRLSGEIHQWMYDRYSLTKLLNNVGFENIKVCTAFESRIENWNEYNLDVINGKIRKPDSLFIEATKL